MRRFMNAKKNNALSIADKTIGSTPFVKIDKRLLLCPYE